MSQTQQRVTATFDASDDDGNHYHIVEYTHFVHTTTAESAFGEDGIKEYKLANGTPLKRLSDTQFEIESSGARIHTT